MNSIVKLKVLKSGITKEFTFEHAQNILRVDKHKDFEIADNKKFQFVNNDLIKKPSSKVGKKPNKQNGDNKGEEVPE